MSSTPYTLRDALDIASRCASSRGIVQHLSHVCVFPRTVTASNGTLDVCVAHGDLSSVYGPASIDAEIVRAFLSRTSGAIHVRALEGGKTRLDATSPRVRATSPAHAPDLFYMPESVPDIPATAAPVAALRQPFGRVSPWVALDASRPWATAVMVQNGFLCASNNIGAARARLDATMARAGFGEDVAVNAAQLETALSLFPGDGVTWCDETHVHIATPTLSVRVLRVAATAPNVWAVIERARNEEAAVWPVPEEFELVLERAVPLALEDRILTIVEVSSTGVSINTTRAEVEAEGDPAAWQPIPRSLVLPAHIAGLLGKYADELHITGDKAHYWRQGDFVDGAFVEFRKHAS